MKDKRLNTWKNVAVATVFLGGVIASFTACEKLRNFRMDESVINQFVQDECECTNKLYYYNTYDYEKKFFTLVNDYLLIGFDKQTQSTDIVNYINQIGLFNLVDSNSILRHNVKHDMLFINTTEPKTCLQLIKIISTLKESPIVLFANFTFESTDVYNDIWTYMNGFRVKLKVGGSTFADLQNIAIETNTLIVGQNEFDPLIYELITDKNSQGDALQMANYFYETGNFLFASPDYLGTTIGRK